MDLGGTRGERHTHIVIGAGAAGCAVAARLSEDPAKQVLLLEAGGRDWNPLIHMPAGFTKLTGPSVNWGFETVPQPELNDRRMHYPQGRTLGGSTSINAMIYIRGNRLDYDEWRDLGNEGWGYEGVLPYFRKSENNERLADEYHGTGGPLNVTEQVGHNPISKGFVRAAQSIGIPFSHDFNGADQSGVGFYDVTQRNVRRESSATAYLGPARKRKNLVIATHAQATQLIIENGRAVAFGTSPRTSPPRRGSRRAAKSSSPAVPSTRHACCSCPGSAPRTSCASSGSRSFMTCRESARTSRTTWMCI